MSAGTAVKPLKKRGFYFSSIFITLCIFVVPLILSLIAAFEGKN